MQANSFLGNALFIFLTRLFPALATTLVLIVYSRLLPAVDYGNYQSIIVQSTVFGAVACLGIPSLVLTYAAGTAEHLFTKQQKWLVLAWMLLLSLVFGIVSRQLHFAIAGGYLLLLCCSSVAESVLFSRRQVTALSITSFLYSIIFLMIHGYFIHVHSFNLNQLFIFLLALSCIRLLIYLLLLIAYKTKEAIPHNAGFTSLWMHLGLYDIVQVLFRWIDKWFVATVLGSQVFAIYFNATIDIPFLSLALGAAGSAGLIQLAANKEIGNNEDHAVRLMNQSGKILSCIVFPLFVFLVCYRYELFFQLLTRKYEASVPIFLISILAVPVRAYSFTTILQHFHKGRIINTGSVLDLLIACALTYPLYLVMGLQGIALSFVISTYLQAAYYLYHSARTINLPVASLLPLKNWAVKMIICFAFFYGLYYLTSLYCREQIVLILGVVLLAVIVIIMLAAEVKLSRQHHVNDNNS